MLTPQEIQDKKFVKAVFGGYDMANVDSYLEVLQQDYASLYKENAVLKSKLKVLVNTVEEYRSVDEAMRKALLQAQQMAEGIVADAKKQSQDLLDTARAKADEQVKIIEEEIAREEKRLATAREEASKFIGNIVAVFEKETSIMKTIATAPIAVEVEKNTVTDFAEEISTSIMESDGDDEDDAIDVPDFVDDDIEEEVVADEQSIMDAIEKQLKMADEDTRQDDDKPKFNFNNLQFGRNYDFSDKD